MASANKNIPCHVSALIMLYAFRMRRKARSGLARSTAFSPAPAIETVTPPAPVSGPAPAPGVNLCTCAGVTLRCSPSARRCTYARTHACTYARTYARTSPHLRSIRRPTPVRTCNPEPDHVRDQGLS